MKPTAIEKEKCKHPRGMLITTQKGNIRCAFCKQLWVKPTAIEKGMKNEKQRNYYAKHNIFRVMSWKDNDKYKFEMLEHYFKKWLTITK